MSHLHRFYSETLDAESPYIELSGDEAHHAVRVVRLHTGDEVSVFDGKGLEVIGAFEAGKDRSVRVRVKQTIRHKPPRVGITLAVGGLHRDKTQEEVVRHAAELGAARVCFWDADHTQRPIKHSPRWRKAAVEACKQCGRFYLPVVDSVSSLQAFLESHNGPSLIALLDEDAPAGQHVAPTDRLALIVGPEGDFSDRERMLALAAGAVPVSLGAAVYRSEVATMLLMTLAAYTLGELGPGLPLDLPPSSLCEP